MPNSKSGFGIIIPLLTTVHCRDGKNSDLDDKTYSMGGKFSNLSRLTHSLTHSLTHWFSQGYIFIGRFSKRGLQLPLREIVLMLKLAIDLKIRPIKM